MKTAHLVKDLGRSASGARQKLYRLSDQDLSETGYVVVSAVVAPITGPETYVFSANETGEILDFSELEGSIRGVMDHEASLSAAGYTLTDEEVVYCANEHPIKREKIPFLDPGYVVDPEPEEED
jgi:hypothetical protein